MLIEDRRKPFSARSGECIRPIRGTKMGIFANGKMPD